MSAKGPRFVRLCDEVMLVVWSLEGPAAGQNRLEGTFGEAISPLACLTLATADGGTRVVWAMTARSDDTATLIATTGGRSEPVAAGDEGPADLATLFEGLTAEARQAFLSALLSTWSNIFKVRRSRSFVRGLLNLLVPPSGRAGEVACLLGVAGLTLVETLLPASLGKPKSAFHIGAAGIVGVKLTGLPGRRGVARLACAMSGNAPGILVIRTQNGFAIRRWNVGAIPTPEAWWTKTNRREAGLRQAMIAVLNGHSDEARAAALEFQLRCPLKPTMASGSDVLPAAQIQMAIAGRDGIFLSGWYRDPSRFIAGFDILDDSDAAQPLDVDRFGFAGNIAGQDKTVHRANGFVCRSPVVRGDLLQPRILMRLKSGVRHLLTPAVQPIDWPEARAAVLRAVPPHALSDSLMADCLAPVLAEMQDRARESVGPAIARQIGPPVDEPSVSLVIPLYKVLDFLPFQIASFAADPQIAGRCEIIYALDSPEQADVVEHMLTGLHLVYGLPVTLAVMPRNGGYALANNRAAEMARGEYVALVNSDVIPIEPGWLGELVDRVASGEAGAAGPKLLFEDDSLQHAGLFFDRDHRGRWLNHHYYKGMPRHYAPALVERPVPGITGACIVMRRSLFESLGRFTEDYVIGDYEDSDLCLKVRRAGFEVRYVPSAELYHLERQSIRESSDYMRGVASQYNSWLHEQRWADDMRHLMEERFPARSPFQRIAA